MPQGIRDDLEECFGRCQLSTNGDFYLGRYLHQSGKIFIERGRGCGLGEFYNKRFSAEGVSIDAHGLGGAQPQCPPSLAPRRSDPVQRDQLQLLDKQYLLPALSQQLL